MFKGEGLDLSTFDEDEQMIYSDIVEVYSQSRRQSSMLIITLENIYLLALDSKF